MQIFTVLNISVDSVLPDCRAGLLRWGVNKVTIQKSRSGVSLVEQDTIENVSYPIKNTFYYFLREKNKLHLMQPFSVDATMFSKKSF